MFVACGIWCLADVSSVSSSSEQTGELSDQTRPDQFVFKGCWSFGDYSVYAVLLVLEIRTILTTTEAKVAQNLRAMNLSQNVLVFIYLFFNKSMSDHTNITN